MGKNRGRRKPWEGLDGWSRDEVAASQVDEIETDAESESWLVRPGHTPPPLEPRPADEMETHAASEPWLVRPTHGWAFTIQTEALEASQHAFLPMVEEAEPV